MCVFVPSQLLNQFTDITISLHFFIKKKIECEGMDWIYLTLDRVQQLALVGMVINLLVP